MMRSFKNLKSDLGNGSHIVTGASPDVTEKGFPDAATQANPDGSSPANTDEAGQPEKSYDSRGTINWENMLEPDDSVEEEITATVETINLNLDKVHGIPGNAKHGEPESPREEIRKNQWNSGWKSFNTTISFTQGIGHLKHAVEAIESPEIQAHLKATGILFRGVQHELSMVNARVGGLNDKVNTSIAGMLTKTQAVTILSNQNDLKQSQDLLSAKMEAMESKLDFLISCLLADDAKKGEKVLGTKCGPELQSFSEDKEGGGAGGSGKGKAVVTTETAKTVQLAGTVAGSSSKEAGGSSGQQRQQQILMDPTMMIDPDTISKVFTQEIEIGGMTERVFYRDPRLQLADEELAKKLNQELNPDYNLEESITELKRVERKSIRRIPRGRGRRGRGRTQSVPTRPIEKGITIREPVEQSRDSLTSNPAENVDRKGKGVLIEESKQSKKDSCLIQIHETVQSTSTEQEEKKNEVIELIEIPEESILQITANPDSSSIPDEGTATIPDGSNPDGSTTENPDAQNTKELITKRADKGGTIRQAVDKAFSMYVENIKKYKGRWKRSVPVERNPDRRRHTPSSPMKENKEIFDPNNLLKFIPESGIVQDLKEQAKYKYSWAEMADRILTVQEGKQKFGLGHPDFQRNSRVTQLKDSAPLVRRIDESLSQEHLDRLMSVSLIVDQMDGNEDKVKMIYFLEDGLNYKINENELMQKNWKELEHVLFLFREENAVCSMWKKRMEATVAVQKRCIQVSAEFKPKYLDAYCKEVEMRKGDAKLETFLGRTMLSFNPLSIKGYSIDIGTGMHRSKLQDLRAAIYQLDADTDELVRIKEDMEKHLKAAEERLVNEFLEMNPMFRRIQESDWLEE